MSDSQMKPMMIMLMFKLHNVNVYTSSIIQTAKPNSGFDNTITSDVNIQDNMFSFSYKFPQQERTMCKSPFPAFLFALQEWFFASCVTRVKKKKKQYSSDSAAFFLKSAGAWKGNDGVGHDGGKSLSGMSCQTKPQSSSRRISHRGHAVSISPISTYLTPARTCHLPHSAHPIQYPCATRLFNA